MEIYRNYRAINIIDNIGAVMYTVISWIDDEAQKCPGEFGSEDGDICIQSEV